MNQEDVASKTITKKVLTGAVMLKNEFDSLVMNKGGQLNKSQLSLFSPRRKKHQKL